MMSPRLYPLPAGLFSTLAAGGLLWWTAGFETARAQETREPEGRAKAGKVLEISAAPSPGSGPAARRAISAMRSENWPAARTAWEEVVRLEPESAAALSNLGKVQYQLSDFPAAANSLEKAVLLKPNLVDSWLTLGMTYLEQKAPMMAVSAMTRGVAESPADPRAHNSLAIVLKRIGWTSAAETELQKALDLNPEYGEAHFNLAVMYLERKPPALEMARRHYDRSLELSAAPDALVEKQLRGESEISEETAGENTGDRNHDAAAAAHAVSPVKTLPGPAPGAAKTDSKAPSSAVKRGSPRKS